MRAALTSLGTRTQTPSAMKECFKVSDLRTVLHQPSRFSIRQCKPPPGPTDDYIQLWRGDVKLPQHSLEGIHHTDCCQLRSGTKPAKQAGSPQMGWSSIEVCL